MMSIATAACTVCTPAAALAAHATTPSAPARAKGAATAAPAAPAATAASSGAAHVVRSSINQPKHLASSAAASAVPAPAVYAATQPENTNVLASGTATDKSGKQVKWQVISNAAISSQMAAYGKQLTYDPDKKQLVANISNVPFKNEAANVVARKYNNITLKVTKDGNTTEESIKETPWFYKSQYQKSILDEIDKTTIGSYDFKAYHQAQKVGGKGLTGLKYNFNTRKVEGTPIVADWKEGETSREIPVYIARIHKGKNGSDYMTVGEFKKYKAYKNRNDIFEGTAGINPKTNQQYQFSDLGDDNVTKTVTAMYADGPIYLKAGETKTVPLKFYLVDENRKPIKDITDEFMKVLAPEPHESTITKVLFTRNRQTSLMDMNVSYVLHTDYSITFTANADAQVGDSYNTDGSKLDNLPMVLDPTVTPDYTYEPGITLHKKGEPGHVAFINTFFDVIPGTPDPKPKPPVVPPAPKPPVPPQPQPPVEPPAPVVPAPEPPAAPTPAPKPSVPTPAPVATPAIRRVPALPRTNDVFAHMGEVCGALVGVSAVLIAAGCGMLSRKRKAR